MGEKIVNGLVSTDSLLVENHHKEKFFNDKRYAASMKATKKSDKNKRKSLKKISLVSSDSLEAAPRLFLRKKSKAQSANRDWLKLTTWA